MNGTSVASSTLACLRKPDKRNFLVCFHCNICLAFEADERVGDLFRGVHRTMMILVGMGGTVGFFI